MLGKYIDKLMPIIAMVIWMGGMGYIVMSLNTCSNDNEVQEVITPKTIDEKIDSMERKIWIAELIKIEQKFRVDSIMAVNPIEMAMYDELIKWEKRSSDDTTSLMYQDIKDSEEYVFDIDWEIARIKMIDGDLKRYRESLDSLLQLKKNK
tara:strand:+ start:40 stop:489 length:450 start_codon:yes stop_codon:yes gene_type:complete